MQTVGHIVSMGRGRQTVIVSARYKGDRQSVGHIVRGGEEEGRQTVAQIVSRGRGRQTISWSSTQQY